MTDATNDSTAIMLELLGTIAETLAQVVEQQARVESSLTDLGNKLDLQDRKIDAIATALGFTYLATGAATALPSEVLDDPAFTKFLDLYPIDGPPIIGAKAWQSQLDRMQGVEPERYLQRLEELDGKSELSRVVRIRNQQLANAVRDRFQQKEAAPQDHSKDR